MTRCNTYVGEIAHYAHCSFCGRTTNVYKDYENYQKAIAEWVILTQPTRLMCPRCYRKELKIKKTQG